MNFAVFFRPRLHEQIKPPLFAQILNPYEVNTDEFAQINHVLFAHVNAALREPLQAKNQPQLLFVLPTILRKAICLNVALVIKAAMKARQGPCKGCWMRARAFDWFR